MATSTLNSSGGLANSSSTIIITNNNNNSGSTNNYVTCKVCGVFMANAELLKSHLASYCCNSKNSNVISSTDDMDQKSQQNYISKPQNISPSISNLIRNGASQISSIIAASKNGSLTTTNKKLINSSVINIPQSMTVFNLKEISTKLSSFKAESSKKIEENDNHEGKKSLTEKDTSNLANKISSSSSSLSPTEASSSQSPLLSTSSNSSALPYHYSECENLYICNLCNCTYDSLRSIKAHLWKHSGHHELSYPIHDYNNNVVNSSCNNNNSINIIKNECASKPMHTTVSLSPPISRPVQLCKTPLVTTISKQELFQLNNIPLVNSSPDTPTNSGNRSNSGGGICSVLLEVIEKLRDAESSTPLTVSSSNPSNITTICLDNQTSKKRKQKSLKINKMTDNYVSFNTKTNTEANIKRPRITNVDGTVKSQTSKRKPAKKLNQLLDNLAKQQLEQQQSQQQQTQINNTDNDPKELSLIEDSLKKPVIESTTETSSTTINEKLEESFSECTIETSVVNSVYDEVVITCAPDEPITTKPNIESNDTTDELPSTTNPIQNSELIKILESLATNDGYEQYVCGLCTYVCYHLPSLKSHMWTHVKNEKFDYSINTAIINSALDYENKLNRNLASINTLINNNRMVSNTITTQMALQTIKLEIDHSQKTVSDANSAESTHLQRISNNYLERQLLATLNLINNSKEQQKFDKSSFNSNGVPMVSFRCSRCGFETIDLCLLRIHKRDHMSKALS